MKKITLATLVALSTASAASASTVSFDTTGSSLSCNGVAACTQNTATSVTVGGLNFTYSAGSGVNVVAPSIITLGNIITTGTGANISVAGLLLQLNVTSTPPGSSGTLPTGEISGFLATNSSSATILFAPNNTSTLFGVLPGVSIDGFIFQVLNPSLGLQLPTVGTQVVQTSIQGAVSDTQVVPIPGAALLMGTGLAGAIVSRRKKRSPAA